MAQDTVYLKLIIVQIGAPDVFPFINFVPDQEQLETHESSAQDH